MDHYIASIASAVFAITASLFAASAPASVSEPIESSGESTVTIAFGAANSVSGSIGQFAP